MDTLNENLRIVLQELDSIMIELQSIPSLNTARLIEIMDHFWGYIKINLHENDVFEAFKKQDKFTHYQQFFSEIEHKYVKEYEATETKRILKLDVAKKPLIELLSSDILKRSYAQIGDELALLNDSFLSKCQTAVMVGSGPFPETALYIAEHTAIPRIVLLDCDASCIDLSNKLIVKLGFQYKMEVVETNALDFDFKVADMVFVANFVKPKIKVLQQISKTAQIGTHVLYRNPIYAARMLYDDVDENFPDSIHKIADKMGSDFFLKDTCLATTLV